MFGCPSFAVPKPQASAPAFAVGRAASFGGDGNASTFSGGFGSAPAAGTWIVLIGWSNTGALTPSGGTNAWTLVGSTSGAKMYVHLAAASEPSTYTITYSGASKSDGGEVSIIEITGANATNPDDSGVATSTATCPTKTSSAANDIAVVGWTNNTSIPTAPSGYTLQTSGTNTQTSIKSALATKTAIGSGSISPGNWSGSGNLVGTVLFKA